MNKPNYYIRQVSIFDFRQNVLMIQNQHQK